MATVRTAVPEDLAAVRELAYAIWPIAYGDILGKPQLDYMLDRFYSVSSLKHQFQDLKHHFIIAETGLVPVGFASYAAHGNNSAIYHLHKLYVLPEEQGKNTGKQLLNQVIADAGENGASALQLNVNRHNKARYFYERHGFLVLREEDTDIGSGYFMNDFLMELKWS